MTLFASALSLTQTQWKQGGKAARLMDSTKSICGVISSLKTLGHDSLRMGSMLCCGRQLTELLELLVCIYYCARLYDWHCINDNKKRSA